MLAFLTREYYCARTSGNLTTIIGKYLNDDYDIDI